MPVKEIFDAVNGAMASQLARAETTFANLDKKGEQDGFVDSKDLKGGIAGFARKYDQDGDGKVSKDEFMDVMISASLDKIIDIEEYEMSGVEGRIDMCDFTRMLKQIKPDLTKDNDALRTILAAMNSSEETGVNYLLFKTKLYEFFSKSEYYGVDESSKKLLEDCKAKLSPQEEDLSEWDKYFDELDKDKNGNLNADDFEGDIVKLLGVVRNLKVDSGEEGETLLPTNAEDSFVSKKEYRKARTLNWWDDIMKMATESLPERVSKDDFLKFLTAARVVTDAATVEKVYNEMPAMEYSVSPEDFKSGMVKFVSGKLLP